MGSLVLRLKVHTVHYATAYTPPYDTGSRRPELESSEQMLFDLYQNAIEYVEDHLN